ncbi:LysR family transcriptional regulator [Lysinibacillus sp. Bpr_S20]|uniref:LysR family transcriptional regulator n=1 Tax=Lysinibacillus sp. Bpr_S20 TaxID=2933964 RepID=UPI002010E4FD|nr:LysR family transcriptional regulator [Lysinibacillus sp. Bpr_S20]MCL1702973.1 LysR family transcriptional regulator [Lysinibacillus sp. Bpr_S20]
MDIKWIQTFITAAEHENFRKTSEILFISQPTVTLHIKNLELLLETDLFKKNGRNISLTEAGHCFLPYARKLIDAYNSGLEGIQNWKQGYKKKLTISIAPHIAATVFPEFLKNYFIENPHIDITINVTKSPDIGQEVNAGNADIGISRMVPYQSKLIFESIWKDEVILVAPKTEVNNIKEEEIFYKYKMLTHNHPVYWEDLLPIIKNFYPNTKSMAVTQVEITKQFIMAGLGISFLPSLLVQKELQRNELVHIPTSKFNLPTTQIYFIHKKEIKEIHDFKLSLCNFLKSTKFLEKNENF